MVIPLARFNKINGFTLVEMLVVLVILSLTTTLLVEGLGTTWRNFDKLNSQQLIVNRGLLPKKWFIDSFKGAQLYHPFKSVFSGSSQRVSFITINPPGTIKATPTKVEWSIESQNSAIQGLYYSIDNGDKVKVANLNGQFSFSYLNGQRWEDSFSPNKALLPNAIKILNGDEQWLLGIPGRDVEAIMPTGIAVNGTHEI
ncbi:hypothetical protein KUL42_42230 [Alteromonas sp. KUL42]|nr:hypothetical protein KUL42_42230 [Alteromonas sp. KUL42]